MRRAASALLLALTGLFMTGCAAAGLAAGPLVSAVQLLSDRSVERTLASDIHVVRAAVEEALSRHGLRVEKRVREGDTWRLTGLAETLTVHVSLDRVTSRLTKVSLRAETGKLLPDRDTSEQLQSQIAHALTELTAQERRTPGPERAQTEAMGALEAEVRRLRSVLDDREPPRPKTAGGEPMPMNGASALTPDSRGIVSIPETYGLPVRTQAAEVWKPASPAAAQKTRVSPPAPVEEPEFTDSPLAAGLRPVGTLQPAPTLTAPPPRD